MFTGLSLLREKEKKPVVLSEEAKARQEYLKKYGAGGAGLHKRACCSNATAVA
jgi:hypothetical protein